MSIAALVRGMAAAGAPAEAIALAVEAIEAEQNRAAEKRAQAAERKRAQRDRERDSHGTVTGHDVDRDATGSKDKGSPCTPSKTQTPSAPLSPQIKGKKRGLPIHADWQPPPIAELSPKAKECAGKWPAGRYEAEAEAFVAFWLNDGRCRPDWRLTWISRIIAIHGQVMRDARFAPTANTVGRAAKRPMTASELRSAIAWAEDQNDLERATELKRQLADLRAQGPPAPIANLISSTAKSLRAGAH